MELGAWPEEISGFIGDGAAFGALMGGGAKVVVAVGASWELRGMWVIGFTADWNE